MHGGGGRPRHAKEKDEDQFVLRLPEPLSRQMRLGLGSKSKRDAAGSEAKFAVHFVTEREAFFLLNGVRYPASLRDFPCIVETHKTADKRTYFKSADVHQVLVVRMPDDPPPPDNPLLPDGITPPAKGAAARFDVPEKIFTSEQIESLECHLKYVVDNKVQFVRKKTPDPTPADDPDDVIIEADATEPVPAPPTPIQAPSPVPGTPAPGTAPGTPAPLGAPSPSPAPMTPAPLTPAPATPAPATPAPGTPAPGTPAPLTPAPATPAVEDDEDDEFADMLAADMLEDGGGEEDAGERAEREEEEARRRIERTTLDGRIGEQKAKIKAVQDSGAGAPNPVIKMRILAKVPAMEAELKKLEDARAALD